MAPEVRLRLPEPGSFLDLLRPVRIEIASLVRLSRLRYLSRQMYKGLAYVIFKRSGLREVRTEKLKARPVDDLCDRFNVTAV